MARIREKRSIVIDDFVETDQTYKKTVRKCREAKETLINSVEQVEKLTKVIEKKDRRVHEGMLYSNVCVLINIYTLSGQKYFNTLSL